VFEDLIEEGRAEGRAEGRTEGRVEGQTQGLRLGLGLVLEQRFGPLPVEMVAALDDCDAEQLTALLPVALTAASLAEFRTHLPIARA
jgi:predicted transposase YdaD